MDTKISEKIHTMESSIQNVNDKLTETSDTIVRMQEEMYVFEGKHPLLLVRAQSSLTIFRRRIS